MYDKKQHRIERKKVGGVHASHTPHVCLCRPTACSLQAAGASQEEQLPRVQAPQEEAADANSGMHLEIVSDA